MKRQKPTYETDLGQAYLGDALKLLKETPSSSINLVVTSPPFALQRKKEYGNEDQAVYVDWLLDFTQEVKRVLTDNGSFVIDLGGAYRQGRPVRSLYNYHVLIRMCEEQEWNLAEEFFWFNPAKLPSPAEWVTKRKIRAKDAVNTVWWMSKTDNPKADIRQVTVPYSESMKKLLVNADYYTPTKRPSGHDIGMGFHTDNGGALPSNLLAFSNTDSNSKYMRYCKKAGVTSHPARFPLKLPEFFIKMLTDEQDVVLDIFAGSNATGFVAEQLNRRWISFELDSKYLAASALRFADSEESAVKIYNDLLSGRRILRDTPTVELVEHETLSPILAST